MTYPNPLQIGGPIVEIPPLRPNPTEDDPLDGARSRYAWTLWDGQTAALLQRDRQIELNARFLNGEQDLYWSESQGAFINLDRFLSDAQRQRGALPRLNRLVTWFVQCKARMVENPPILTFLPGPDAIDAELAETMDILFKAQWRDLGMADAHDQMAAWNLIAGSAYIESRIDATTGEPEEWWGEAEIPVIDPVTQQPIPNPATGEVPWLLKLPRLPLGKDGQPNAVATFDPETGPQVEAGEPHVSRAALIPEVYSPLQVRGEWGDMPWHRKRWHAKRCFLTPDQVKTRYGKTVQPTALGIQTSNTGTGALERLTFGSGYFGAASHLWSTQTAGPLVTADAFVEVLCLWEAPTEAHPEYRQTEGNPGGRYLCCTRNEVLYDGNRPLPYPYTSPLREFRFLDVPGRPSGTTLLEFLVPIQRAYNRTWGSIQKHVQLVTNPIMVVANGTGLNATEVTNEPGQKFNVNRVPGVPAMEWLEPPSLGAEVFRQLDLLLAEINDIGSLNGTDAAEPVGKDASGELVKELRFNSDRFLGPTMRMWVEEYGRLAEDWMVIFPQLWPTQKILRYAGEDNIARTLTVLPMMFEGGKVNVQPDVESMLPEGRGERQARAQRLFEMQLLSPDEFLTVARFPHAARFPQLRGGVERATAQQIVGKLLQGDASQVALWKPWWTPPLHLEVLQQFIASPEFLKLGPPAQQLFEQRWLFLQQMMQQYVGFQQHNRMATSPNPSPPPEPNGAPGPGPASARGPSPLAL